MTNLIPRPEHPNPQWKRDSYVNLNGEWMFEIDKSASGVGRGLHKKDTLDGHITLPFCPESPLSGVGERDFMLQVWYKRVVNFTAEELDGRRIILHFGAADFETELYVNGKSAGTPHVGGQCSFSYDITSLLTVGENILTVRCYDDTRSPAQACGKQSERYNSYGCYYTRTTGIWQTVWYESVPESYIKGARITPDANNGSVSITAELCGSGTLTATAYYKGKKVGEAIKRGASVTSSLEISLSETHLWDLGKGELYDLVFTFSEDRVESYFGLRHIEMKDGKFFLNGRSVFQRLVLDQGYYADGVLTAPTDAALARDIEISMAAGFNGARLHQKVFEPRFLYHADRLGYMVWGEYGNWGLDPSDISSLPSVLSEWCDEIERDYNHPSIIGWCPFNETWYYGAKSRYQDDSFIRTVWEQTKRLDKTRPCIDTSGGIHVVTDIFDVHNYQQDPKIFRETYDRINSENFLYDEINIWFNKKEKWRGEPVFVSEYGGIGLNLRDQDQDQEKSWSYGSAPGSVEEFHARYKGLTDVLLDNPRIFAFCYTQLTDVEQEVNGLYTFAERKPKVDIEVIRAINTRKAAVED